MSGTANSALFNAAQATPNNQMARIDMIGAACESAEKVIADTRKTYFGTRQGPTNILTLDKAQATKIQEQGNALRHVVNHGQLLKKGKIIVTYVGGRFGQP